MASSIISFSCAPSLATSLFSTTSSSTPRLLSSRFLGTRNLKLQIRPARLGPSNGSRTTCWFKFGKNGVDAENAGIYGSQSRDDFDRDDVEQIRSINQIKVSLISTKMATEKAKEIVNSDAVVVFSKTFCPYCVRVKELLQQLGAKFKAVELDTESDGSKLQSALAEWTGQRTVPNVFIGGNHIGGCDATSNLHKEGKLVPLLTEAGAIAGKTATTSA